jgi:hypothetical protein
VQELPTPIWPPHEAFYIQSMLFNSTSAVRSILRLESIFEKLPAKPSEADLEPLPVKVILHDLQNMVTQAGALSRYFWPVRKKHKARGKLLRDTFVLGEDSPIFNRDLRNAMEHFDERIDIYFPQNIVGCFFPEYVGFKPDDDGVPGHFFRAYFMDTGEFRLLDEEFLMQPLADELFFIHRHLELMDRAGGRFSVAKRDV